MLKLWSSCISLFQVKTGSIFINRLSVADFSFFKCLLYLIVFMGMAAELLYDYIHLLGGEYLGDYFQDSFDLIFGILLTHFALHQLHSPPQPLLVGWDLVAILVLSLIIQAWVINQLFQLLYLVLSLLLIAGKIWQFSSFACFFTVLGLACLLEILLRSRVLGTRLHWTR